MAAPRQPVAHRLSHRGFSKTMGWTVGLAIIIVGAMAALGRAAHNFSAALTDKPDVALYLLLPDEEIGNSTLLREEDDERVYLADTKDGPELITLRKGEEQWYIAEREPLRE